MSLDRFVRFKRAPSLNVLAKVAENYLGGIGSVEIIKARIWFTVSIPGKPTPPLLGIAPQAIGHAECMYEVRWFEVWRTKTSVDVLTRMADAFTAGLAERYAEEVARYWQGEREQE